MFLPPATKLGQGYIFTGVCDSVHRGVPGPGGVCSRGGSAMGRVPGGDPPGRPLLRAVRILLECILVCTSEYLSLKVKKFEINVLQIDVCSFTAIFRKTTGKNNDTSFCIKNT